MGILKERKKDESHTVPFIMISFKLLPLKISKVLYVQIPCLPKLKHSQVTPGRILLINLSHGNLSEQT